MKDDNKELYYRFPPCVLFLNDVGEIIKVFKESSKKIIITAKGRKITNADDINKLREHYINNLHIQSKSLNIHLKFKRNKIEFYAAKDNKHSRRLLKKIWHILAPKRRKFHFFHTIPGYLTLLILFTISILLVHSLERSLQEPLRNFIYNSGIILSKKLIIAISSIVVLPYFIFLCWFIKFNYLHYSVIYTNYNFIKGDCSDRGMRKLNLILTTLTFIAIAFASIFTVVNIRQQRSYYVNSIRSWIRFQPESELLVSKNGLDLSYTIKNFGETPALKFTSAINFYLRSNLPEIVLYPKTENVIVCADIFPGDEHSVSSKKREIIGLSKPYNKEEIKNLIKEKKLYLISYLKYEDAFGLVFYNLNLMQPLYQEEYQGSIVCSWASINSSFTRYLEIPESSRE